jgi:hypothetical protein
MQPVSSVQDHAEGHLRVIRAAMERAGVFTALSGWAGVLMGAVALATGYVARGAASPRDWVLVWLVAAAVAVPVGAAALVHRARRAGVGLTTGVARRFVLTLTAPVAAGAVLTAALLQRESYGLLPAVWLLLYGTGVVVAGSYSTRLIQGLGASFMALGAVSAFTPWPTATIMTTAGFGGLHLLAGLLVLGHEHRSS